MAALPRRIIKETQRLMQEPVPGISAIPDEQNARYFHVIVFGPEDSPFEGGLFKLELFLPEDYPMSAPKVRFITKIYHPNIDRLGRIHLSFRMSKQIRHSKGQVEPGAADSHGAPVDPGTAKRTEPGRSAGE